MAQIRSHSKVVKALAKGQVTIPIKYRRALGINANTLLTVSLEGNHLEIAPVKQSEDTLRRYTDEDIGRFLDEDKLDQETARQLRDLLGRGAP